MKIAAAQIRPVKGAIKNNIELHKKLIFLAISQNVDFVFFPELSISSYEPQLAKNLALDPDDDMFLCFQEISNNFSITIAIGVPTKSLTGIRISMLIFNPKKPKSIYSKQLLHSDEFPFFEPGNEQILISYDNKNLCPAICFESLQKKHAEDAHLLGADIYLASVAKSNQGIEKANLHYPFIAKKYNMPIIMANCIGNCDNFECVGKSSVWSENGTLLGQLNSKSEGLIVFDSVTNKVSEHTMFV